MHHTTLDKAILIPFGQGDRHAYREVYNYFHDPIYYFTIKLLGDRDAAKDVVEETFVKLWKRHNSFETVENIKAFLYIAARNACFDHIKKAKRKEKFKQHFSLQQQETDNTEELMVQTELLTLIYSQMHQLPEKCREIFKMSYVEGLGNEEIAEHLAISPHTVRTQKRRAITFFKTNLSLRGFLTLLLYFFH